MCKECEKQARGNSNTLKMISDATFEKTQFTGEPLAFFSDVYKNLSNYLNDMAECLKGSFKDEKAA